MLFQRRQETESEEAVQRRIEEMQAEWQRLMEKTPAEVTGDPMESIYYQTIVMNLVKDQEPEQARELLGWVLRRFGGDAMNRLVAAVVYAQLGDTPEAIAQLGVALAIDPTFFPAHKRLAHYLRQREEAAAEVILENGWRHAERHYPRAEREAQRVKYFAAWPSPGDEAGPAT
jgi:tetratricopeptide (TPR) repeat protein